MERKTISIMKACELVGRQPPDHLQLARERKDRVRAHRRRLGPDFRRHAVARSERQHTAGRPVDVAGRRAEPGLMRSRRLSVEELQARGPMDEIPELRTLFHRLNNQLGIILAHAELLESKSCRRHASRPRGAGRRQRARSHGHGQRDSPPRHPYFFRTSIAVRISQNVMRPSITWRPRIANSSIVLTNFTVFPPTSTRAVSVRNTPLTPAESSRLYATIGVVESRLGTQALPLVSPLR